MNVEIENKVIEHGANTGTEAVEAIDLASVADSAHPIQEIIPDAVADHELIDLPGIAEVGHAS
jgi:hypothetical protein